MVDTYESTPSTEDKIATRNSWLKVFVVVATTLVLGVKIWQGDFSQAFTTFEFSDLLALFLSMFAIGLSVLFYMKATETANVFYDNTYRFTRDVSEILGRVEAGFGEKLAHLDEGYAGLKTAVEQIPFDQKQAEKDIKAEEEQLQKVQKEREELIDRLAERARLEGEEKNQLFARLQEQDEELSNARREIASLQRRIRMEASRPPISDAKRPSTNLHRYLRNFVKSGKLSVELLTEAPMSIVNDHFKELVITDNAPTPLLRDLVRYGIVDNDYDLTRQGRMLLRDIAMEGNA